MTTTTSTLSNDNGEANDASYDKYLKVPLDIDNNPIRYDGNPAHILGCLLAAAAAAAAASVFHSSSPTLSLSRNGFAKKATTFTP